TKEERDLAKSGLYVCSAGGKPSRSASIEQEQKGNFLTSPFGGEVGAQRRVRGPFAGVGAWGRPPHPTQEGRPLPQGRGEGRAYPRAAARSASAFTVFQFRAVPVPE